MCPLQLAGSGERRWVYLCKYGLLLLCLGVLNIQLMQFCLLTAIILAGVGSYIVLRLNAGIEI